MKIFANLNKKVVMITETQQEQFLYDKFCQNQSFRYNVIGILADKGYIFHGTTNDFEEFDQNKVQGGVRGVYGYGAYFTDAAYKCEEYGDKFIIMDANSFNIINTARPCETLMQTNIGYLLELPIEREKIINFQDNCCNAREYDYYQKELEKIESLINQTDKQLINRIEEIISKQPNMSIDELRKTIISNSPSNDDFDKRFSDLFLNAGYDGFKNGNQYVIFNFTKLNQNIVKNKEQLISKVIN